jgi:hypothetical protein
MSVTLFVAGSIRATVLSTSFVTHSEPAAATTAAGCFPVATAVDTVSGREAALATAAAKARMARAETKILDMSSSLSVRWPPERDPALKPPCKSP